MFILTNIKVILRIILIMYIMKNTGEVIYFDVSKFNNDEESERTCQLPALYENPRNSKEKLYNDLMRRSGCGMMGEEHLA